MKKKAVISLSLDNGAAATGTVVAGRAAAVVGHQVGAVAAAAAVYVFSLR